MDKELERYTREIEKAEAAVRKAELEQKEAEKKRKELMRRARDHRIYIIGGILEPYLNDAALLTQEDVKDIIDYAFNPMGVKNLITARVERRKKELTVTSEATDSAE